MKTLIHKLQLHLQSVPSKIQKIPLETMEYKPLPHKWSKKEILGHLIDSAQNNWRRFVEAQYSTDFYQIHGYNQDEYVRINAYQQMPLQEVIQTWTILNQQILKVWQKIPTEKLSTKVINTDGTASDLQWWITDYVRHLEHHLDQIFADVSIDEPANEETSKRQFIQQNRAIGGSAALAKLAERKDGKHFLELLSHGSMLVEIYQPQRVDLQQVHSRDELYVVYSGSGTFFNDGIRHPFQTGDVLFVPAGVEHRFEDFSEDFATWVVFYGPEGGEANLKEQSINQSYLAEKDDFKISTDDAKLDIEFIFRYLHQESYWAKNIPKTIVEKSLKGSLNFGLYHQDQQIGFARLITDYSTFAYLADVFVAEPFRGEGLGLWLSATIRQYKDLQAIRRWMLMTHSAQGLYEKVGFQIVSHPERVMEIADSDSYIQNP